MADLIKGWLTLDKDGGSGNGTVTASANQNNTGRNTRSTSATFKASGCSDVSVTINQMGKAEFVSADNSGSASALKTGGTVTLTGTSNSSKLTFAKGTDNIGITLPTTYTAGGVSTNNGTAISGDPGASQQYVWSIQLTVPANGGINSRTCQITITDNAGHDATYLITQAAGDPTLSVSPLTIDLPWDGATTGTLTVMSNTNWSVV